MTEELPELLVAVRRGEDRAVRELVARFERPARALASAILGDPARAEDAVQDAFLAAIGRVGELRDPRAFPAWFRQLVRTAANRIARRRTEERLPGEAALADAGPPPGDSLERAEVRRAVRGALAALPEAGRETAQLFYLEGRGIAEIAATLDVPPGTVKRRLHDARAKLRDLLLGAAGGGEPETSGEPL